MILAIGNDGQFARFCEVAGHAEWAVDERFATNAARVANRAVLISLLRQATVMRTTREWVEALESRAVPCGPINRIDEVFADPQVVARGLRVELPHPVAGTVPGVAEPDPLVGDAGGVPLGTARVGPAHRGGAGGVAACRSACGLTTGFSRSGDNPPRCVPKQSLVG